METEDTNNGDKLQECTYCYHLYSPKDKESYSFEEGDNGLCQKCKALQERKCKNCDNVAFGSIQTTRGCPLNCTFCSVTAFNGARYRQRPISEVMREFQQIREKYVLVVDDNLIGTRPEHIARAKDLFRAMAQANLRKQWIAQATINFADDEELLDLAAKAGCCGVFIGFESDTPEGLQEVGKKFNLLKGRDFRASVQRIRRHNILVMGSFIIGLDIDKPGIGKQIAEIAGQYGIDNLNVLFLTPLPGTHLWDQMKSHERIALNVFPEDWKYYTLTFPVARYKHLSLDVILREMISCNQTFYSLPHILCRVGSSLWHRRKPWVTLVSNLSYRNNIRLDRKAYADFKQYSTNGLSRFSTTHLETKDSHALNINNIEFGSFETIDNSLSKKASVSPNLNGT